MHTKFVTHHNRNSLLGEGPSSEVRNIWMTRLLNWASFIKTKYEPNFLSYFSKSVTVAMYVLSFKTLQKNTLKKCILLGKYFAI
jgi:hypothetical protein